MKSVSIGRVTAVLSIFLLFGDAAFSERTASPAESATGQTNSLPVEVTKKIDEAATKILSESGVPSISIAVVKDGILAYTKAYGLADIASHRPATTSKGHRQADVATTKRKRSPQIPRRSSATANWAR